MAQVKIFIHKGKLLFWPRLSNLVSTAAQVFRFQGDVCCRNLAISSGPFHCAVESGRR